MAPLDPWIMFMFLIFPLGAEVIFAFLYQEMMGWHTMTHEEKALFGFMFPFITFPVLILPSMAFVALFGTLFDSLYY